MTPNTTIPILESLDEGAEYYFAMSEGGGAKVVKTLLGYDLYEIPQYGGEERYTQSFYLGQEQQIIDEVASWT